MRTAEYHHDHVDFFKPKKCSAYKRRYRKRWMGNAYAWQDGKLLTKEQYLKLRGWLWVWLGLK